MYRIENLPVTRLKEYENNPRNNEIAVDKVAASIKRLGYLFPIIVDINYVIICGHTRKKACEKLGIKSVPCIKVDELSPEQIRYFRLADNRTSEYASWDLAKLEEELKLINLESIANQLLLETFDLETELTEFENELTEIKVESFNFLASDANGSAAQNNSDCGENYKRDDKDRDEPISTMQHIQNENSEVHSNNNISQIDSGTQSKSFSATSIFEIGKIRFVISSIELNMLNAAYAKYIDKVYPAKSFIDYLLEGKVMQ